MQSAEPTCIAADLQHGAQYGFTVAPFLATVSRGHSTDGDATVCGDGHVLLTLASGATAALSPAFVQELVGFAATSEVNAQARGQRKPLRAGNGPQISTPAPIGLDEAPSLGVTTEQRTPGWVPLARIPAKEPATLSAVYGSTAERTACEDADATLIVDSAVIAHNVVPMSVLSIVVAPYMARIVCTLPEALGAVTELTRWDSTQLPAAAVPSVTKLSTALGIGIQGAALPPRLTELDISSPHVQIPLALRIRDLHEVAKCRALRRLTLWGQVPDGPIVEAAQSGVCFPQVDHLCAVLPQHVDTASKAAAALSQITPAATSLALYVLTQHWGTFLSTQLAVPTVRADDATPSVWPHASTLSLTVEGGSNHEWFGIRQVLTCRPWVEFEMKQDGIFCQYAACADIDAAQVLRVPAAPLLKRLRLPRKQESLTNLVSRVVPFTSEHTPSLSRLELCSTNVVADSTLLGEMVRNDSPLTAPVTEVAFLVDDVGKMMSEYRRTATADGAGGWRKLERPPAPEERRGLQVVLRDPTRR